MGASSSGLLDETKISHITGLVDSSLQSFSAFYRQQYSVAHFAHLQQEVEPKREGRGLLLTRRPHYSPEEVLYQSSVQISCWDETGKKCRERYAILRRDYRVEIHDNLETFSRGCAAKMDIQPAGASVFTTEEESRAHLEKTCAGVLTGAKEDSSAAASPPDVFAVYLHLPYRGHTRFLFEREEERDRLLSALRTCIRHRNLDTWSDSSYESQAFARALRRYRQDKGCYESWEILLGTEAQVLASQVMEEVLPWLLSQLQSRVKGKKTERIRLWLATVQATYVLVLERLSTGLEALRGECRQTASVNQTLIRSDLDQIVSSHRFLEQKIRDYMREEAEKVCSECISPYVPSILEVLAEHVSDGVVWMRDALQSEMNSAFSNSKGGAEEMKKALSGLNAIDLDECYKRVDGFSEKVDLKQRFGLSSSERLLHSAHLEIQKLLDGAVYTLEKYLQSSAKQASQIPVKMERAKERVLKQLDHDSRVVQTRLYEEALVQITLPCLTRRMDKRRSELQQFEQFIFSDYTSFILVRNIYEDALRNILSEDMMKAVHDAASKKSNNLLLDASDLALSQYSLLDPTPPRSPDIHVQDASSAGTSQSHRAADDDGGRAAALGSELKMATDVKSDQSAPRSPGGDTALTSPVIVVTQQCEETESTEATCTKEIREDVQISTDQPSKSTEAEEHAGREAAVAHDLDPPNQTAEAATGDPPEASPLVSPQFEDVQAGLTLTPPPQNLASPEQSAAPPSPATVAIAQCDESAGVKRPGEDDQEGAGDRSSPAAQPESSDSHSAVTDDHCNAADVMVEVTGSSDSCLESPEAPKAPDGHGQSAKTENCVSLSGTASDHSVISLGSLSEAICRRSSHASVTQTTETRRTDRAVYLTGEIKNKWVMERHNQEKEAVEKSGKEMEDTEKEEETREERDVAQVEGEAVDEGYRSSGSPAESTVALSRPREAGDRLDHGETGPEADEEPKKDVEGEAAERKHQGEEEAEKKEVLQSPQSQSERDPEPLPDSVAVIRELVMEITEIEELITLPS